MNLNMNICSKSLFFQAKSILLNQQEIIRNFFPKKDMQTLPLSFDLVFMDDAQCAETNENINFPIFPTFIFRVIVKVHRKLG